MSGRPAPIPEPFGDDLQSLIATVLALKEAVEMLQGLRDSAGAAVTAETLAGVTSQLQELEDRIAALE